jgi:hypothetical protein
MLANVTMKFRVKFLERATVLPDKNEVENLSRNQCFQHEMRYCTIIFNCGVSIGDAPFESGKKAFKTGLS